MLCAWVIHATASTVQDCCPSFPVSSRPGTIVLAYLMSVRTNSAQRIRRCVLLDTQNTIGNECFAAAVPLVWNSLPAELRYCDIIGQFKQRLKTYFRAMQHHIVMLLLTYDEYYAEGHCHLPCLWNTFVCCDTLAPSLYTSKEVFLLKCAIQTYAWGKKGSNSEVARLMRNADDDFYVDENTTYAELWMGTHPKGPSLIASSGESLARWIGDHRDSLGDQTKLYNQLPFLFKVLSVNVALSIQVHPDKTVAEKLHAANPAMYGDDNHKPELAIALTPFEALCGFRPKQEIIKFLNDIVELHDIVGDEFVGKLVESSGGESDRRAVRDCFTALMTCPSEVVQRQLTAFIERLQHNSKATDYVSSIVLRLHSQFPGDVGCFCVYFLNLMSLQPGQAIFLHANIPHAYLSGDCLECMACSDNVVRAGLTPKFKDVETLCEILDYRCRPAGDNIFLGKAHPSDNFVILFDPPVPEFTVAQISLPVGTQAYTVEALNGASIIIVLSGTAKAGSRSLNGESLELKRASVVFMSAAESLQLSIQSCDSGMVMYRAFCTSE